MALQGSLRDFSVNEILSLLGTQKKTGCLMLQWNTERAVLFIQEGRIISTRDPGMKTDDSLLRFLRQIHRLSDEQQRGLQAIHKEASRDLEDLLINGRYLEQEELRGYVERQILDDLMRLVRWESGTYRFDPNARWPNSPLARLSMEGALIEAARRVDEQKQFLARFKDPYELIGVRDLPDPDEQLADEERELFGIIDGQHTVAEIVDAAPLSEYEAYEALNRMIDANWIESVGRRDPGIQAPAKPLRARAPVPKLRVFNEVVALGLFIGAVLGMQFASRLVHSVTEAPPPRDDVYVAAQMRDLRYALDLYRQEHGGYPGELQTLVEDDWLAAGQLRPPGYVLRYTLLREGTDYRLELKSIR